MSVKMKKNEFKRLDKKIRNIENKLIPILSTPRNPETTRSDQLVVQKFHQNLHFMNNLLSVEMASSSEPRPLADIINRVLLLQKAAHAWTEGRPLTPLINSGGSSSCSFVESCLTDDDSGYDYKGELSGLAGFKVYENPLFAGVPDDDNDNDNDCYGDDVIIDEYEVEEIESSDKENVIGVADQDEVQESEAGNEGVEKEVIKVDHQKEECIEEEEEEEEDDDDDEEGTQKCCYKIIFWGMITVMVGISVLMGFSDIPDDHAPVILLAPT